MSYIAKVDGQEYRVELGDDGIVLDGSAIEADLETIDGGFHYSLLVGAASHEVFVERCEESCFVSLGGLRYRVRVEDERDRRPVAHRAAAEKPGETRVLSPMPGVIAAVLVEAGQEIRTGEGLLILEAMKMENEIRAPQTGTVAAVYVTPGQRVNLDDVLVEIELRA